MASLLAKPKQNEDQRAATRVRLLIRAAKITHPGGEFLCVVHDVSDTGVRVRLFHPLPAEADLVLHMPNGDRLPVERVWEVEGRAGFRFREPQDVARLVACPSPFPKRAIRIALDVPCELGIGDRRTSTTLCNLSQQGAMIRTIERLAVMQRVTLSIPGAPKIAARVCWRSGDGHGLSFEDTLQYADLAAVVFQLQHGERH